MHCIASVQALQCIASPTIARHCSSMARHCIAMHCKPAQTLQCCTTLSVARHAQAAVARCLVSCCRVGCGGQLLGRSRQQQCGGRPRRAAHCPMSRQHPRDVAVSSPGPVSPLPSCIVRCGQQRSFFIRLQHEQTSRDRCFPASPRLTTASINALNYYEASFSLPLSLTMSTAVPDWKNGAPSSLIPTLSVEGATAALAWYQKVFDGTSSDVMMDASGDKLMHACLNLPGDGKFFLADPMPTAGFSASVMNLYLYVPDVDAAYKRAVEGGAKSGAEPTDQFWGDRSASVIDPFGIRWSLATFKKKVSEEEVNAAGAAWAAKHAKEHAGGDSK